MKLITSSTPVFVATYESGAFLCNISLGVGSGARLEHPRSKVSLVLVDIEPSFSGVISGY